MGLGWLFRLLTQYTSTRAGRQYPSTSRGGATHFWNNLSILQGRATGEARPLVKLGRTIYAMRSADCPGREGCAAGCPCFQGLTVGHQFSQGFGAVSGSEKSLHQSQTPWFSSLGWVLRWDRADTSPSHQRPSGAALDAQWLPCSPPPAPGRTRRAGDRSWTGPDLRSATAGLVQGWGSKPQLMHAAAGYLNKSRWVHTKGDIEPFETPPGAVPTSGISC